MKPLLLLLSLLLFSVPSTADWKVETLNHSASGSNVKSAMIRNEAGFELAIFKSNKGIIWMDFSLSDNDFSELAQNQLPRFQIDNHKPVQMIRGFVATIVPEDEGINAIVFDDPETISTDKDFSVNHIVSERLPERVICPIFQGDHRPHFDTLNQLLNGSKINFNYVLLDGTKGQTHFTLKGAKQALEQTVIN